MLSIRSLGKRYPGGTVGLSDFSLDVGEGVLGLLRPNMGLSNVEAGDFTSALSAHPVPMYSFISMGLGAALVGAAVVRERFARP